MADAATLPFLLGAERYGSRPAIVDSTGIYTYNDLLDVSAGVAATLLAKSADLGEQRVGFLVAPSFAWVAVLWGIWRAGGIAVPLPIGSPVTELEYFVDDTKAALLIYDKAGKPVLSPLA